MSDTPRTDKEMMQVNGGMWYIRPAFARELERELNALKASIVEPPEPTSEKLTEDFRRIALLVTSRCTRTKMTAGEKRAWKGVEGTFTGNNLEMLEWFYGLDKSPEFDQTWRRVGMPATLLNNLDNQLDFAYEMKESMRKSQPKLGTAPQW